MKRNGRNILSQGAAVVMAILLAMPALPARAAEAGKGMEVVSIVPQMASGAGVDAAEGSAVSEMLTETDSVGGRSAVDAEIIGGGGKP